MKRAVRSLLAIALSASVAAAVLSGCAFSSVDGRFARSQSAADVGGLDALITAAKKEGKLHAIALPRDWANYGELIDTFQSKYGIEVIVENPDASSQDEINAVASRKGLTRSPDVIDVGQAFGVAAADQGLLAPYRVQGFDNIPLNQRDPEARWYNSMGGFVSIGCDVVRVGKCPTTFAELLDPRYRAKVALSGNPAQSGSAFSAVYAASLAHGGSFADISPGLAFFEQLVQAGNFNPVKATPATIQKGETPITIDWDYLNTGYGKQLIDAGGKFAVTVPNPGTYAQFYSQAIVKWAPHPAAARLWQEFLYSPEGQNLWLKGYARPVLMEHMRQDGTLNLEYANRLPKVAVAGPLQFPTQEQSDAAKSVVVKEWGGVVAQ